MEENARYSCVLGEGYTHRYLAYNTVGAFYPIEKWFQHFSRFLEAARGMGAILELMDRVLSSAKAAHSTRIDIFVTACLEELDKDQSLLDDLLLLAGYGSEQQPCITEDACIGLFFLALHRERYPLDA